MSLNSIGKISNETKRKLLLKSVKGMANNPSEKGANPQQVKNALVDPYLDDNISLLAEINRIVDELNANNIPLDTALTQLSALATEVAGKQSTANLYDGLDSDDATKYLSAKQGKVLKQLVDGKNSGLTYNDISTMISTLNSADNSLLKTGDNIYILDTDVPDFWVSGVEASSSTYSYNSLSTLLSALNTNKYVQVGYYKLSKLETEKVDLSDYQPKGSFLIDSTSTTVNCTYELNKEKTYSASNISVVSLTIPSTISQGFYAGANIKISSTTPTFSIVNNSSYPLKIIELGLLVDSYTPKANTTITTLVYNDGLNTYLQISEV